MKPSQKKTTIKYSVPSFTSIKSDAIATIVFTQSDVTAVEAYGPSNYMEQLAITCKDNTLYITTDKSYNFKNDEIKITVSSPSITHLSHDGVGNILLKDPIKVDHLTIVTKAVGNITAEAIAAHKISVSSSGVGNIILKGKVDWAEYHLTGVGNLDAKEMIATDVIVEKDAVGNLSCYGSGKIEINNKGVGNVDYYGNTTVEKLNNMGIGKVRHK